ncbi:hypothetical protein C8A03DRAFT_36309 [Achaetomium macrosporum]|uniref:Uncharacterized protein n=1 Tax=Achaetomium macrosporum TaxID=79813 RepID=A0AAN7H5E3_9PEZI|nr:hypothetical protein C8A03DRAFT_36309 [Achaetomium macrosporum]
MKTCFTTLFTALSTVAAVTITLPSGATLPANATLPSGVTVVTATGSATSSADVGRRQDAVAGILSALTASGTQSVNVRQQPTGTSSAAIPNVGRGCRRQDAVAGILSALTASGTQRDAVAGILSALTASGTQSVNVRQQPSGTSSVTIPNIGRGRRQDAVAGILSALTASGTQSVNVRQQSRTNSAAAPTVAI